MRSPPTTQTVGTRPICRLVICTIHSKRCCTPENLSFNSVARSRRRPWKKTLGAWSLGVQKSNLKYQSRSCAQGLDGGAPALEGGAAQVAMDGDTVVIHYICRDEEGNVVDDSATSEDPVSFEVGAGEITGNPLFQAFDEAIRGLPLGSTTILEAKGGDWKRELFFEVPRDHEEMQRLEGRYKNQGGLQDGLLVELSNGASAMVVAVTDDVVKIDANNMMAGKRRIFEVTLLSIEPALR